MSSGNDATSRPPSEWVIWTGLPRDAPRLRRTTKRFVVKPARVDHSARGLDAVLCECPDDGPGEIARSRCKFAAALQSQNAVGFSASDGASERRGSPIGVARDEADTAERFLVSDRNWRKNAPSSSMSAVRSPFLSSIRKGLHSNRSAAACKGKGKVMRRRPAGARTSLRAGANGRPSRPPPGRDRELRSHRG